MEEHLPQEQNFFQVPVLSKKFMHILCLSGNIFVFILMCNVLQYLPMSKTDMPGGYTPLSLIFQKPLA